MAPTEIALKRIYEQASAEDGMRILVERLWPRGLRKADAAIDYWAKDVAPSPALRTCFGHRPERWEEFQERYLKELEDNQTVVRSLQDMCSGEKVTFVFAAKNELLNSAVVLKKFLETKS